MEEETDERIGEFLADYEEMQKEYGKQAEVDADIERENNARYAANYRTKHKNKITSYQRISQRTNRKNWLDWLPAYFKKCWRCGYDECFAAIDFHHLDPENKEHNIGQLFQRWFNPENISIMEMELAKCLPLCATCHRQLHDELRKSGVQ